MVEIKDVSFSYFGGKEDLGLQSVNLTIRDGETVLLCGKSGCGKTTLTRLVNGLIPHYYDGTLKGNVIVEGKSVPDTELYDIAQMVGSVFQNPRSQFFNVDTTSELAFGCENLGMPENEVRERIRRTVNALSLEHLLDRSIFELSGGEKQKIACGSVSALEPKIIVLDEPTSNLDFDGIRELRGIIRRLKAAGKTILIAEHRLHFLKGIADRVVFMEDGKIREEYSGREFFSKEAAFYEDRGLRIPSIRQLPYREKQQAAEDEPLRLKNFCFGYPGKKQILHIPECEIPKGIVAVIGHNGAGKTTFAKSVCGLLKRDKGELFCQGRRLNARKRLSACCMVMQDTNHQLFTESVIDEVLLSMKKENREKAEKILDSLDLLSLKDEHPMSLSGGQKQRVAVAAALGSDRRILVFDEPTSGLDLTHMRETAGKILELGENGAVVLVVTHAPEFISCCCTHVLHMEQGRIVENYPLDREGQERMAAFFEGTGGKWEHADTAYEKRNGGQCPAGL